MKQGDNLKPIMEKTIKTFKANKIACVERWIMHFGKDRKYHMVEAKQMPNGKWECEIEIPLINQTVKATSASEIYAMLNAANKATKLIKHYLENNPDIKWIPLSKFRHWEIDAGEFGFVSLHLNNEYREKIRQEMLMAQQKTIKAVKKAISRIKRINGSDKDLFVQVLDRSLFDENATNDDNYKKIFDTMYNDHNIFVSSIECDNDNGHIIVVGYSSTREEFDKYLN